MHIEAARHIMPKRRVKAKWHSTRWAKGDVSEMQAYVAACRKKAHIYGTIAGAHEVSPAGLALRSVRLLLRDETGHRQAKGRLSAPASRRRNERTVLKTLRTHRATPLLTPIDAPSRTGSTATR